MTDKTVVLLELENYLSNAASALRAAYIICKDNGMENTASSLADVVLDCELSMERLARAREA